MDNNNFTIIKSDAESRSMTIGIPEEVVNKLERSQDEYYRKIGDCSIILTDLGKSTNSSIFELESHRCVDLYKVWVGNKNYIRDGFVYPAIDCTFTFDEKGNISKKPLIGDASAQNSNRYDMLGRVNDANWQINYDRNNKVEITDIESLDSQIVYIYTTTNNQSMIDAIANADYLYNVYTDIYKDIVERDLVTESNYDVIKELDNLRKFCSENKTKLMDEFYKEEVHTFLKDELNLRDDIISKCMWQCDYSTYKVTITKNK